MSKSFILFSILVGFMICACSDKDSSVEPGCACDVEFIESIAAMDWGNDTTFVFGHKTPDVDAVTSSLAYAALMRSMGHNAVAKVSSPVNRETELVAERLGFKVPELMTSVPSGTRLILTDHAEYAQSVDGARDAKILQIIDHHTPGDIEDADSSIYVRRDYYGSTCTVIRHLYEEAEVKLDDEVAKILLAGILSDTRNLTKSNTTRADTLILKELQEKIGLSTDTLEKLFKDMSEVAHDYSGMSAEEIFLVDYKDYDMGDFAMGIASIIWYDESSKEDLFKQLFDVMPKIASEKERDILFAKVDVFKPNTDPETMDEMPDLSVGSYILYYGKEGLEDKAKEIAEAAFGKSVEEGICYSAEKLSRKTDMVPMLTEVVKQLEPK